MGRTNNSPNFFQKKMVKNLHISKIFCTFASKLEVKPIKANYNEESYKRFLNIAYQAMQSAYHAEMDKSNGVNIVGDFDFDNEEAKKIGKVLQAVGDLSRSL